LPAVWKYTRGWQWPGKYQGNNNSPRLGKRAQPIFLRSDLKKILGVYKRPQISYFYNREEILLILFKIMTAKELRPAAAKALAGETQYLLIFMR
jgi:hypothetical protein